MGSIISIGILAIMIVIYGLGYSKGYQKGKEENPFIWIQRNNTEENNS